MDDKALDQCLYEIAKVEDERLNAEAEEKLQWVLEEVRKLLYNNDCVLYGSITIQDINTNGRYSYEESKATRFRR